MKLDYKILRDRIRTALEEDKVSGDITSDFFCHTPDKIKGVIEVSNEGIICGIPVIKELCRMMNGKMSFSPMVEEGDYVKDKVIGEINGSSNKVLSAERIILNFLSHLSGIAFFTSKFVNRVEKYDVKIMDTRKTTPGLRHLEKYAVFIGGGNNHRMDLNEMILIKDNHLKITSKKNPKMRYKALISKLRKNYQDKKIELEVENVSQLNEIFFAYPDIIMLDNMEPGKVKRAVELKNKFQLENKKVGNIELEASGGINLNTVEEFAKCGIDRISVGSLTNSAPAVDFSMSIK